MAPAERDFLGVGVIPSVSVLGVFVLGCYGSLVEEWAAVRGVRAPWSALVGAAFALCFLLALNRAPAYLDMPWLQLPLVLSMVGLSFALHLLYLPAGLCCFVGLMMCKNELLLPPSKNKRQ